MLTYIMAFIFYTFAMIGVMLLAFVIYKKTIMPAKAENKGIIKILDKTAISPKKSLLIVKVKNEKFLIAMDAERTTFLSKLSDDKQNYKEQKEEIEYKQQFQEKQTYVNDLQKQRLENIKQQFSELYKDENKETKEEQAISRKEMIRKLLKDLNNTTVSTKTGSY